MRMFGFNYAPKGWANCDGHLMSIMQNQALFSIIGTTYGGDGRSTFALPDLRSRSPVHFGTGTTGQTVALGEVSGEENHTLLSPEMPIHTHSVLGGSNAPTVANPQGAFFATSPAGGPAIYNSPPNVVLDPHAVGPTGGSQSHNNLSPYSTTNICIALVGIFPSRN